MAIALKILNKNSERSESSNDIDKFVVSQQ